MWVFGRTVSLTVMADFGGVHTLEHLVDWLNTFNKRLMIHHSHPRRKQRTAETEPLRNQTCFNHTESKRLPQSREVPQETRRRSDWGGNDGGTLMRHRILLYVRPKFRSRPVLFYRRRVRARYRKEKNPPGPNKLQQQQQQLMQDTNPVDVMRFHHLAAFWLSYRCVAAGSTTVDSGALIKSRCIKLASIVAVCFLFF